jgi:branched-subunit amino acid transport protein
MIDGNYFLFIVLAMAVGTLAIRYSFIALTGRLNLSPRVRELFTYIPAAILPALFVPATFFHQGKVDFLGGKERFLILLASGVACYLVRNTFFVVSFGLVMLYLVTQGL